MSSLLKKAKALQSWSSQHRRFLHQHPEKSLQEKNTSQYCQEILTSLGLTISPSWGHGFTAELNHDSAKETIALRADMDALPMQENNQHDFVSKNNGVAHMCGHDVHMAIALTTARILAEYQQPMAHNVRFIFQPSEEMYPGGAIGMIEQGCLNGVAQVYGLHNDPGTAVGSIRTRVGPLMAADDRFQLQINGRGCHAASPQDGLDSIVASAQLVLNWQTIIARHLNPAHTNILSVTQLHAGFTHNILPDSATLSGTLRTFLPEDREQIKTLMQASLKGQAALGFTHTLEFEKGYAAVVNHASGVARLEQAALQIIAQDKLDVNTEAVGWAEDFCYYLQQRPGAFYFLGSGNKDKGITSPLHASTFDVDEDCIPIGAAVMANLIV